MTDRTNEDGRLKKELGVAREPRGMADRKVTEDRETTDADRLEMFRQQMFNDALPDLPDLPGWHVCWLTTTNSRDPIHRRMQLGYQPIKPEEIPGMQYATIKTGEWQGMVGVNEMVAFKLPESLYQAFMREAHYEAPLRDEQRLAQLTDDMRAQAAASGADLEEFDGLEDLRAPTPKLSNFS